MEQIEKIITMLSAMARNKKNISTIFNFLYALFILKLQKHELKIFIFSQEWSEHNIQNLTVYVMIIISMTYNIFLVCYIGEIITEEVIYVFQ